MEEANSAVGTFPNVDALINQVVNLLSVIMSKKNSIRAHLTRDGFAANAKNATFPWGQKVHGPRLLW